MTHKQFWRFLSSNLHHSLRVFGGGSKMTQSPEACFPSLNGPDYAFHKFVVNLLFATASVKKFSGMRNGKKFRRSVGLGGGVLLGWCHVGLFITVQLSLQVRTETMLSAGFDTLTRWPYVHLPSAIKARTLFQKGAQRSYFWLGLTIHRQSLAAECGCRTDRFRFWHGQWSYPGIDKMQSQELGSGEVAQWVFDPPKQCIGFFRLFHISIRSKYFRKSRHIAYSQHSAHSKILGNVEGFCAFS